MKKYIAALLIATVTASSAAIIYLDEPGNYVEDRYWPDLPGASNMGGATYVTFAGVRQGFYMTSDLDGKNARTVIFNSYLGIGVINHWRVELLANTNGQIDRLDFGATVDGSGLWINNLTSTYDHNPDAFESDLSPFVPETMYVGFRRVNDETGEIQYGWAELKTVPLREDGHEESWAVWGESSAGIKFTRNAYETSGDAIFVGQTVSVPEPTALFFVVFGALPLLSVRRR